MQLVTGRHPKKTQTVSENTTLRSLHLANQNLKAELGVINSAIATLVIQTKAYVHEGDADLTYCSGFWYSFYRCWVTIGVIMGVWYEIEVPSFCLDSWRRPCGSSILFCRVSVKPHAGCFDCRWLKMEHKQNRFRERRDLETVNITALYIYRQASVAFRLDYIFRSYGNSTTALLSFLFIRHARLFIMHFQSQI